MVVTDYTGMWYHYLWKFWYAITKWHPNTEFRGGRGRGVFGGGHHLLP